MAWAVPDPSCPRLLTHASLSRRAGLAPFRLRTRHPAACGLLAHRSRLITMIMPRESNDQPHDQALCLSNLFLGGRLRCPKVICSSKREPQGRRICLSPHSARQMALPLTPPANQAPPPSHGVQVGALDSQTTQSRKHEKRKHEADKELVKRLFRAFVHSRFRDSFCLLCLCASAGGFSCFRSFVFS